MSKNIMSTKESYRMDEDIITHITAKFSYLKYMKNFYDTKRKSPVENGQET